MKNPVTDAEQLAALISMLRYRRGQHQALTIAEIAASLGISRRAAEVLLECRLPDLPFCVVSGSAGYYRPMDASDINHYRASLLSRIRCLAIRSRTVACSAAREGYRRDGRIFSNQRSVQAELWP